MEVITEYVEDSATRFETGRKDDDAKLRYDLIDFGVLDELVKRFTHGAEKYGPNNWQLVDNATDRYQAALLRHLSAYAQGESMDPDSGLTHISAVLWNAYVLTWFDLKGGKDGN